MANRDSVPNCSTCTEVECDYRGKQFDCPGCGRSVPWCYGCDGDMPELCDGCWLDVIRRREEVLELERTVEEVMAFKRRVRWCRDFIRKNRGID